MQRESKDNHSSSRGGATYRGREKIINHERSLETNAPYLRARILNKHRGAGNKYSRHSAASMTRMRSQGRSVAFPAQTPSDHLFISCAPVLA